MQGLVELITVEKGIGSISNPSCANMSALSKIFRDSLIDDIEIIAHDPEDTALLFDFLMRGSRDQDDG